MDIYIFTIPNSKEAYNSIIRKFISSYRCTSKEKETNDGLVFYLEFTTESLCDKFKTELASKFPNIYM
jgi:hypothetical protein